MADVQHALQYASTAGFCILALITLVDWLRNRGSSRRYLALAIGLLAVVSLVSQLSPLLPGGVQVVTGIFSLTGFMAAGYALLLFRDSLVRTATGKMQKFKLRSPYWEGRERRVN